MTIFLRGFTFTCLTEETTVKVECIRQKLKTVPEDLGTIIIVFHGVLHKTEAVDVTDVGVSVGSEEIKATDSLLP